MDVEKLIEQLNRYFEGETLPRGTALAAATALSTIQDENEKLRVEAEGMRSNWYKSVEEIKKLRAEVESLKKGHCAGCSIPAVKAEQIRDLTDAPKLRAELEQERANRLHAEQYADAFLDDCKQLNAELERVKRLYESEKENFIDFACSGVPNLSPYCMNRRPDCVDERGWCRSEKCHGFSRERGQKED